MDLIFYVFILILFWFLGDFRFEDGLLTVLGLFGCVVGGRGDRGTFCSVLLFGGVSHARFVWDGCLDFLF